MDAPVAIPRGVIPQVVFLRSRIPAAHPSAPLLGEERMGAGVSVDAGRVLTAHYLVMGASEIQIAAFDGRERAVRRISLDHETGLALLGLEGPPLPAARLRPASAEPGLPVFLVTCTGERERKGATGHVATVGPFEAFWEYMLDRAIMTTAVNPGLAGAPLFDAVGRLLGVVSLGLQAVGRYSLAIPIDLFVRHRAELMGEASARPRPAWVGFYPQAFDGGLLISGVVPGGPADRAGIARGDLVVSIEGQGVDSLRELYGEIRRKAPGEKLTLQILRDSAIRTVEVTAGDRAAFFG